MLNKISASSIAAFKTCSTKYRLSYVEGIRPDTDADSLRVGSSWHGALEAYEKADSDKMIAAVEYLNERYAECPLHKDLADWQLEHVTLTTCVAGYYWFWQNDQIEVLATELAFDLPLHMPRTGLPLPTSEVVRTGKIDALVLWQGKIGVLERKSTSRSIDPDSDFWTRWRKDTQISNYCLALRDMAEARLLPANVSTDAQRANVIVDIFRKPTIGPKMLTQSATAEFIESKSYMNESFVVDVFNDGGGPVTAVMVDAEHCEIEQGKKGFAIRETLKMFSARLLAEIQERPNNYFARREIARTDQELAKFRQDLYTVYQSMKLHQKNDLWIDNEQSCDSPYRCAYKAICYGAGSDSACNRANPLPQGFKRLAYVDLTVNGHNQEE